MSSKYKRLSKLEADTLNEAREALHIAFGGQPFSLVVQLAGGSEDPAKARTVLVSNISPELALKGLTAYCDLLRDSCPEVLPLYLDS